MKFVFDLDGTPVIRWCHTDDEIKQVLLRAEEFTMKSPLLLHVLTGLLESFRGPIESATRDWFKWWIGLSSGAIGIRGGPIGQGWYREVPGFAAITIYHFCG